MSVNCKVVVKGSIDVFHGTLTKRQRKCLTKLRSTNASEHVLTLANALNVKMVISEYHSSTVTVPQRALQSPRI